MGGYILVIDDDLALLDALEMELTDRGYTVKTAPNGAEAMSLVRDELPMLIITDLEMPVMNGRKMLQILRQKPEAKDVPVIILSAFGYEWEAELMGAQGYIRKPVGTGQLEQAIARVLGGEPAMPRPKSALMN